ncbi:MAG: FKBP-type peptidyl-prolyl cis-trans isomerase [Ardenticatenaceae bacterium]|nr:FKBP-type peptidyl-prolyl cis-trans isomerase [Ardenticatenaceae bacterium]
MTENAEVREGATVTVAYTLRRESGESGELPGQPSPLQFTYGTKKVLPGLQAALLGMHPHEQRTVTLGPTDAFGERHPGRKIRIKRSQFPETLDLYPGRRIRLRSSDGDRLLFFVTHIKPEHILLDSNHPFAGEKLTFTVTVLDVAG